MDTIFWVYLIIIFVIILITVLLFIFELSVSEKESVYEHKLATHLRDVMYSAAEEKKIELKHIKPVIINKDISDRNHLHYVNKNTFFNIDQLESAFINKSVYADLDDTNYDTNLVRGKNYYTLKGLSELIHETGTYIDIPLMFLS
jgi:short subunit fatty acids transporter